MTRPMSRHHQDKETALMTTPTGRSRGIRQVVPAPLLGLTRLGTAQAASGDCTTSGTQTCPETPIGADRAPAVDMPRVAHANKFYSSSRRFHVTSIHTHFVRLCTLIILGLVLVSQAGLAAPAYAASLQRVGPDGARHGALSVRRTFDLRAHGHFGATPVSTRAFAHHLRSEALRAQRRSKQNGAAEFAIVKSVGRHSIFVQFVPWRTRVVHGTKLYSVSPLVSTPARYGTVTISPRAWLRSAAPDGRQTMRRATSLAGLHPGMTVFLGGDVTPDGLRAHVVLSLVGAQSHPLTRAMWQRARVTHVLHPDADVSTNPTFGGSGVPELNETYTLNQTLFDIPKLLSIALSSLTFQGKSDASYSWPFSVTASPPNPFYNTEPQTVGLQMDSQAQAAAFAANLTLSIAVNFSIYTVIGCGTAYLQSCNLTPSLNIGVAGGNASSTDAPAPLQSGASLAVNQTGCPGVSISLAGIVTLGAGWCTAYTIHGTPIYATVAATSGVSSSTTPNPFGFYAFDGMTSRSMTATPNASQVDLKFSNFSWTPTVDVGGFAQLTASYNIGVASGSTGVNSPTITYYSQPWQMIGSSSSMFTPTGPSALDLFLPSTLEPASLTVSAPSSGNYGEPVTVSGTLLDRNNNGVAGQPVMLNFNGEGATQCGQVTGSNGSFSCTYTPADVPSGAAYTMTLSYAGNAYYVGSSKDAGFLSVGGYTAGTYGGSASMKGTLTEDNGSEAGDTTGTGISSQSIGFAFGTQRCASTTDASGNASCTLTVLQPAGPAQGTDSFAASSYYQSSGNSESLSLTQQTAGISLGAADANPIQVNSPGGTASPTVVATLSDTLAAGDIANGTVSFTLTPIGPGATYNCTVTPTVVQQADGSYQATAYTISSSTSTSCPSSLAETFNSANTSVVDSIQFPSVAVNVYLLAVQVSGSYYSSSPVDGSVTTYDPSLGFTTGGGFLTNPVTGYRANFGFNAKYLKNGNTQGHVVYVEHRPSGDVIVTSNAMRSLSIVNNGATSAIAYIQGKATYQVGTNAALGNYSFLLTAIDNGTPGAGVDQLGLQVKDSSGASLSDLTFPVGVTSAPTITGGNVVVPHQ